MLSSIVACVCHIILFLHVKHPVFCDSFVKTDIVGLFPEIFRLSEMNMNLRFITSTERTNNGENSVAISAESDIFENLKKFSWLNQKDFRYLWFILILKIITSVCLLCMFLGSPLQGIALLCSRVFTLLAPWWLNRGYATWVGSFESVYLISDRNFQMCFYQCWVLEIIFVYLLCSMCTQ